MKLKFLFLIIVLCLFSTSFPVNAAGIFHPDKSNDETLNALVNSELQKFSVKTFSDDVTGLSIRYNVYLPENHSQEKKYPVVFFIADGSAAEKSPEFSLTQGYGGLIWTKDENYIVIVPTYPEMILDDHNGFVVTDYVSLTKRFIDFSLKNYSIDLNRVYATGQSMGCMTFLILASEYPELFTACLFVSGQWDISKLEGLKTQKFIYVASNGDDKASKGQSEVINMFSSSGIPYVHFQNVDAENFNTVIDTSLNNIFVTFKKGSTLPDNNKNYSEHMTSFDYAYKNKIFRAWISAQTKGM